MGVLSGFVLFPSDMADAVQGDATLHNPATGALQNQFTSGNPANNIVPFGSTGDLLSNGIWCIAAEIVAPSNVGIGEVQSVALYDADLNLIIDITSIIPGAPNEPIVFIRSDHASTFYVAVDGGAVFSPGNTLYAISDAGVIGGTTWQLPVTRYNLWAMTVNYAGTIAYWTKFHERPFAVHRYDMLLNVAMTDLATGPAGSQPSFDGLFTLPDGSILLCYQTSSGSPTTYVLNQYDTAGLLLNTLSLGSSGGSFFPELGVDPSDDTSFYVKSFNAGATVALVQRVKISDFSILSSFTVDTLNGTGIVPVSCPVLVFPSAPSCQGEIEGTRTDGLPYTPVMDPPCIGSGQISGSRTGT